MASYPPLPPLHGLAAVKPVPTEINVVDFLSAEDWWRLSVNDPQGPQFEETKYDNNKKLVYGEPSPWKIEEAILFPQLEAKYAHLSATGRATADMRSRDQLGDGFVVSRNNPEFYAHLLKTANAHFENVAKTVPTKKFTTLVGWERESFHEIYLKLPPGDASPAKLIKVTTAHYTGSQKTSRVGDLETPLQFKVSLPAFVEQDWNEKARQEYGTSDPSKTLDKFDKQWESDFLTGSLLDFELVDPDDPIIQVADDPNIFLTDTDKESPWATDVGLFFQSIVYTPDSEAQQVPAAFPICARAPAASRTIAFLRVSVTVVQDRSPADATYSSDTYYMKFPVAHDWSVTNGWSPEQLGFLRACLCQFPVFDLGEMTRHLADLELRAVDGQVLERFREYKKMPGQTQRKRVRQGDAEEDDAMGG